MKINIFDENLNLVAPIGENYISCLWAEGYNTVENFTLELLAIEEYKKKIKPDMYVGRTDRENLMVIKTVQEVDKSLIISGKQAIRVLEDVAFVGSLKYVSTVDKDLAKSYNETNKYLNVEFIEGDLEDTYQHQISNKSMLELSQIMCQSEDIGIKAVKSDKKIHIKLYKPNNKAVRFSEYIGNVVFGNVINSTENYKNYAIVLGQGEEENREKIIVDLSEDRYHRREMLVDAKDLQQEEGEELADYRQRLTARGIEKLLEQTKTFSIDITNSPKGFGKDFDLGYNALIIIPEYNLTFSTRIAKFEEKSQQNRNEVSITLGELTIMR